MEPKEIFKAVEAKLKNREQYYKKHGITMDQYNAFTQEEKTDFDRQIYEDISATFTESHVSCQYIEKVDAILTIQNESFLDLIRNGVLTVTKGYLTARLKEPARSKDILMLLERYGTASAQSVTDRNATEKKEKTEPEKSKYGEMVSVDEMTEEISAISEPEKKDNISDNDMSLTPQELFDALHVLYRKEGQHPMWLRATEHKQDEMTSRTDDTKLRIIRVIWNTPEYYDLLFCCFIRSKHVTLNTIRDILHIPDKTERDRHVAELRYIRKKEKVFETLTDEGFTEYTYLNRVEMCLERHGWTPGQKPPVTQKVIKQQSGVMSYLTEAVYTLSDKFPDEFRNLIREQKELSLPFIRQYRILPEDVKTEALRLYRENRDARKLKEFVDEKTRETLLSTHQLTDEQKKNITFGVLTETQATKTPEKPVDMKDVFRTGNDIRTLMQEIDRIDKTISKFENKTMKISALNYRHDLQNMLEKSKRDFMLQSSNITNYIEEIRRMIQ